MTAQYAQKGTNIAKDGKIESPWMHHSVAEVEVKVSPIRHKKNVKHRKERARPKSLQVWDAARGPEMQHANFIPAVTVWRDVAIISATHTLSLTQDAAAQPFKNQLACWAVTHADDMRKPSVV